MCYRNCKYRFQIYLSSVTTDYSKDCISWLLDGTGSAGEFYTRWSKNGLFESSLPKFYLSVQKWGRIAKGRETKFCPAAKTDKAANTKLSTNNKEIWHAPLCPASFQPVPKFLSNSHVGKEEEINTTDWNGPFCQPPHFRTTKWKLNSSDSKPVRRTPVKRKKW